MRLIAFILSIFLAWLTLVPCSDGFASEHKGKCKSEKSLHSDSDLEDHQEYCTPFCVCACCGINIDFNSIEIQVFPVPLVFPFESTSFYQIFISSFNNSIWQPPKVLSCKF